MKAPPLPPNTQRPNWWGRNWKWCVPVIAVSGIALFCAVIFGLFLFIMSLMKSSGAYELAIDRVSQHPEVQQRLGERIEAGWFVAGNVHVSGSSGNADLSIPISGPKGKATIDLLAQKSAGKWQAETLVVDFPDSERLDLLEESSSDPAAE